MKVSQLKLFSTQFIKYLICLILVSLIVSSIFMTVTIRFYHQHYNIGIRFSVNNLFTTHINRILATKALGDMSKNINIRAQIIKVEAIGRIDHFFKPQSKNRQVRSTLM